MIAVVIIGGGGNDDKVRKVGERERCEILWCMCESMCMCSLDRCHYIPSSIQRRWVDWHALCPNTS